MADGGSLRIVLIALGASVLIACAKFGAYLWTGSSAILSAAVYSLCAASCQTLLLYGRTRSDGQGDARQRFAYAKEMYFWSLDRAWREHRTDALVDRNPGPNGEQQNRDDEAP
ncbi:MAG: cation transporter, partial [Pseudomonadota bacterium]